MMSREQHMLLKLMEECDEVGQRASKLIQFGRDEVQMGFQHTNGERLRAEINDLISVVVILESMQVIAKIERRTEFEDLVLAKRKKIDKYYELSLSLGRVEPIWKPIATAPDNRRILVRGPSGYVHPHDVHMETVHTDTEYRPPLSNGKRRWLTDSGDALSDGWPEPTEWRELP